MRDLTPRQQENLQPIGDWIDATGLPSARAEPPLGSRSVNSVHPDFRQERVIERTGGGVRQGIKI